MLVGLEWNNRYVSWLSSAESINEDSKKSPPEIGKALYALVILLVY